MTVSRPPSESDSVPSSSLAAATVAAPFGLPLDLHELEGTVLTSAHVVAAATSYTLSDRIFSYAAPGAESLLDSAPQLWKTFQKKNANGHVPELTRLEVRSGALNTILGYLDSSNNVAPISVFIPGSALSYIAPTLIAHNERNLPLAFQVVALDYDNETSSLVSNFSLPLAIARNLGYSVVTPFSGLEAQHFSILSLALAKLRVPTLNLYDGPSFTRASGTINNVLGTQVVSNAYNRLVSALNFKFASENITSISKISVALDALNETLGTSYKPFEYAGSKTPSTVFVIYGSVESSLLLNLVEKLAASTGATIGAVAIRIPLPFESATFASVIPETTRRVIVIGQTVEGSNVTALKSDVSASLFLEKGINAPSVGDYSYPPTTVIDTTALETVIASYVALPKLSSAVRSGGSKFSFWSADNSKYSNIPSQLAHALSLVPNLTIKYRAKFDNIANAGVLNAEIVTGSTTSDEADVTVVESKDILNAFDVTKKAKKNSAIILVSDKKVEDISKFTEEQLPNDFKKALSDKKLHLVLVDLESIGEDEGTQGRTASIAIQAAFWKTAYPTLDIGGIVTKILQAFGSEFELLAVVIATAAAKAFETGITEIPVSVEWSKLEYFTDETLPSTINETAFVPNARESVSESAPQLNSTFEAAKKLVFKEAYGTTNSLRPDLPVRNFVVKVKENRRLTPEDYSRNIFHIEFDVSGTGLTYDIGEALGIHGRNNPELVEEFLVSYGLDGDSLVEVVSRDDSSILETRTVRQSLIENVDLFGCPPKRFYEGLAVYATDDKEKAALEKLASPAGAATLKEYQEVETYSFADIFELFPSARPTGSELVQLVSPLKRREYSIASSQKMHPNEVHLLIVVVDWVDQKGRKRFGHCSKYLSELNVGSELVVSVKPSVMKLPPLTTQPIVMAGLGTGLAPFKAFVEERIYQKEQGHEIGEIYLYLGSRHRKEEYLYGEFWESCLDAGVMTHLGAAFSRDQPEKIYIQDKIRETLSELTEAIASKNGSFYLCGPTWPVPDITACLEDIVENDANKHGVKVDSAKEVEEMKESGRYILEVY
ncbi:hypothetical protein BVG19_g2566 [[Candida] boidinii]|nr:hypothetical protein BVG19_g2566 [[Candida] boidinii]OWB49166.1 oxidoreductase activity protein [[Candida] boidinii]